MGECGVRPFYYINTPLYGEFDSQERVLGLREATQTAAYF